MPKRREFERLLIADVEVAEAKTSSREFVYGESRACMDELDRLKAAFESLPIGNEAQLTQLRHELRNIIEIVVSDAHKNSGTLRRPKTPGFIR